MDRPLRRSARLNKNEVSADQEIRPDDQQPRVPCSDRSSSARSSAATMRRLAEARAARELAELEERRLETEQRHLEEQRQLEQRRLEEQRQLEQRRLEAERARIEAGLEEEKAQIEVEEVEKASSRASLSRVEKASSRASLSRVVHWLNQNHSPKPEANRSDKLLGRLSARDLPTFSGDALEWLRFKHAFESTTRIGQYSEDENVARLQRCLRGEAWETVAARIITVSSAQEIMKTLEMRFGRPDLIVQKIIGEIKKIPKLSGSRTELVTLATKVSNCLAAITATNCSDYLYSPDLVMEIVNKLTENLVYRWIDYSVTQDAARRPKLAALSDYLMREAELVCKAGVMEPQLKTKTFSSGFGRHPVLAMVDDYSDSGAANATNDYSDSGAANATNMASINAVSFQKRGGQTDTTRPYCPFCEKDGHDLNSCSPFSSRSVDERWDWICNKKLCFKCFSPKHRRERCRSRRQCATCSRGHHTLLHREDWLNWTKSKRSNGDNDKTTETTANLWTKPEQEGRRYVGVLPVNVEGPAGSVRTCVMIDGGSTISLIDSRLAEKIGAEGPRVNLNLQGAVGETKRENDSLAVAVTLHTSTGSFYLPKIRTVDSLRLPTQKVDRKLIESCLHLQDVPLEEYDGYPEILIGQDYLQLILIRENREGRANEPVASRTNLGWVLHGFVSSSCKVNKEFTNHLHHSEADVELHELVNDYFRVDSLGVKHEENDKFSPGEQRAMSILDAKTRKIGDRWETGLLWRSDDVALPENKGSAVQRLKVIERMMDVDPAFSIDYSKQVDNLLEKHYAEEVHETLAGPRLWYLPHFGVRNPSKPGKLRLVHDARAETKGISLNTELLAGPDLLNSLVGVLFRFRERAVAVTGDIKEMFMRVKINEEDQKSQLFLWRGMNRDQPPRTYKMTSMIFGAKSSPCTATYIIRKNADQYAESHPRAVIAIKRRHYVDDYCDSVDTVELVADVTAIHIAGGFEIRGFVSNKSECLPEPTETPSVSLLQTESSQRTLGMIWKPQKDALGFDLSFKKLEADIVDGSQKPTKRQMLKVIMSVFDPLGFLGPLLIRGKILLQQLWRSGVKWDELIGDTFTRTWSEFLIDLKSCEEFMVPRCYGFSAFDQFQLHVFVDASEQAFSAVAYLRRHNGEVAFAAGKCRVAPLKLITIPRLELQAALMGARLGATVQREHDLNIVDRFFWTDSRVVWHWLQNNPQDKKSFVSNRISEIRELSNSDEWKWLPGELNVADEATRAKRHDTTKLKWTTGPDFLKLTEDRWPKITPPTILDDIEYTMATRTRPAMPLPDINRFSRWLRLIRASANVILFVERLRNKSRVSLESRHMDRAEQLWIIQSQHESFGEDIARIETNKPIEKCSKLKNLCSYIDDSGVLRLKGRARVVQDVDTGTLDPVLLDGKHQYTRLMIRHYHEKAFHGNTETVVNDLRQKYWVINLRSTVKAVQHSCLICRQRKSQPLHPPTGDLPLARLAHHHRVFAHCGLDYFGPMTVTIGRRHEKRYGALFTCMTTRAVHIELAGSLTTDSAIMALRRMMNRRGNPKVIYSDNGTNFRGANTELKRVLKEVDQSEVSKI
ncbi:unnamed protein product [Plutella xylostella]|uniref:(diamondback moth) hypothetical protein n=1 Tax=Plutella xylostella TaxID=51655 RepID=A0A8S4GDS4_PLUXY|nr:unnamed protein product [Plutella xylostella]